MEWFFSLTVFEVVRATLAIIVFGFVIGLIALIIGKLSALIRRRNT